MQSIKTFEAHTSYVLDLQFTSFGKTLISAGMDNVVRLWSVPNFELVTTFEGHANSVNSFALSPNEETLATGSSDKTVKLWSFPDGQLLHTLQDRKQVVSAVEISPHGEWVAAASYGGRVMIWTLDGEDIVGIKASKKNLSSMAFTSDMQTLASSGLGDDIHLWSIPGGQEEGILTGHEVAVGSLRFIHKGRHLVSKGYEDAIRVWDVENQEQVDVFHCEEKGFRGFIISPDERLVALSLEGKAQLRSLDGWGLVDELTIGTKVVNGMAFSPDQTLFAAGAADKKIRVCEL